MRCRPKPNRASPEQYLGLQIKRQRQAQDLKLSDVARIADISQGMLSKIENAQVSTSLDTLSRLCDVLGYADGQAVQPIRSAGRQCLAGQGRPRAGGGAPRHREGPHLPFAQSRQRAEEDFEAYMVSMDDASEEFPTFAHPGTEFLHLLEGELVYRHGNQLYHMQAGDSLTFDGETPHGPEQLVQVPIRLLSIMNYGDERTALQGNHRCRDQTSTRRPQSAAKPCIQK
jgi:transcriptional regulator with XRE-family HTH domain